MPEYKIQYNQYVIQKYETISLLTADMRIAAEQGEWDKLIELEQQCGQQISGLKEVDAQELNEADRLRKVALIRKILADDAEIRRHTEAWMAQLQHIMQSTRQELRLNQTYGAI